MKLYRVDELEISPEQREIRRNGEPLRLRPIAFDLLLYLILHRDRILPQEELLDRVWKRASARESSLLQCISEMRKPVDDDPRQPRFIRSVARAGYRFERPLQEVV